jgi:hypothetical protein
VVLSLQQQQQLLPLQFVQGSLLLLTNNQPSRVLGFLSAATDHGTAGAAGQLTGHAIGYTLDRAAAFFV